MQSEAIEVGAKIAEEDRLRADMYGFLASLLRAEPPDELLAQVAALKGDDSPIGEACATLAKASGLHRQRYHPQRVCGIVYRRRARRGSSLCELLPDRIFER